MKPKWFTTPIVYQIGCNITCFLYQFESPQLKTDADTDMKTQPIWLKILNDNHIDFMII